MLMQLLMKGTLVLLFVIVFGSYVSPIQAAKKRIFSSATRSIGKTVSYSTARLSRGTNSVILIFLNLSSVKKVSYTLNYVANGMEQGVVGSLVPSGQISDSRDLYFGTCSKGVCTPHYNIRNATILVTTTLTSGTTNVKRYRIKI